MICPQCGSAVVREIIAHCEPAFECVQCLHWGTLAWGFAQLRPVIDANPASDVEEFYHAPMRRRWSDRAIDAVRHWLATKREEVLLLWEIVRGRAA